MNTKLYKETNVLYNSPNRGISMLIEYKSNIPFLIPGNEANGKSVTKREMS
jgi:hypothetical protein